MEERGERWRRDDADGGEWRATEEEGCRQSVDGERKEKESDGGEGRIGANKRLIKKFFLSIIVRSFCGPRVYVLFDETDG